ncbi:uncharacterized protein LOC127801647 [Diospyros lotus]|uniref:uncharacterized protein LOC127801647 n=1 Tax=Diospyros lotus TaxID=55363 RepID=UPI0022528EA6|nr:uncharacterized protein LOC127801647 [Diospyros lotus]
MEGESRKPLAIRWVSSTDSPEFTCFTRALSRSSVIGLDAEWKPHRAQQSTFPTVSLLQIACRLASDGSTRRQDESLVFLLDLLAVPLPSIYQLLKDMFGSPDILKLGFRFKQDLVYLSSTFCSQGCDPGFDRVEPFLDITSIYNYLQHKQPGRKTAKEVKSLATICEETLGISLSKELQCSDWSLRPLTEEQKAYAAADAHCLLELFNVFQIKVIKEGNSFHNIKDLGFSHLDLGLKEILKQPYSCDKILRTRYCDAVEIVQATASSEFYLRIPMTRGEISKKSCINTAPMDDTLSQIVRKYGDKIRLKESDRKPKTSRKKGKRKFSEGSVQKERQLESSDDWQGPPPWDLSLGGDGCPKFLCDVMVEGLAKHLRCVGLDAAVPYSKKPGTRDLIEQAHREKRILLTRDAKLLRHEYLLKYQIYRVKSLLKNEQLLEVIETFQLKISEDQLMSRCTKCNGRFIQKPLTTEEAVEAAKGFQVIPNCLFDKNLDFWQCMDCNQLYWEGTQYHNAVQKFIDVCKLNE